MKKPVLASIFILIVFVLLAIYASIFLTDLKSRDSDAPPSLQEV